MNLNYSDEQTMLRDGIAKFVNQEYTFDKRMAHVAAGETAPHWAAFAEMGWLMVPFTETDGGISGSAVDTALVMQEFGKGLVVEPYVANTVLAGGLLAKAGSDAQKAELLEPLMGGELRIALAFAEPSSRYQLSHVTTDAIREGDNYRVNGHKAVVIGGDVADKLLLVVRTSGHATDDHGISLLLLDFDTDGVERRCYQTVDGQGAADILLKDVVIPASNLVGEAGAALAAISDAVDCASLAVCAEAVGAMEAALAITLEYTKTRKQFGQPIASFQVLQHRMVEMLIEIEQSRSIVLKACLALDGGQADAAKAVSAAKIRVGEAARLVGEEAVQMHGGIGITEEYSIGHYLKRLTAIRYSFGSPDFHKQRYLSAA
jgi:alkylation response protein AidB-like acyl-CoA dehydrogenase